MTLGLQSIGFERQTGRKTVVRRSGGRARSKIQCGRERERLSGARRGAQTVGRTNGWTAGAAKRLGKKGFNFWDGLSGPGSAPSLRIMVLQDLDSQAHEDNQHAEM